MYKRKTLVIFFICAFPLIHRKTVEAGPMKRLSRMVREVYPPDIDLDTEGSQPQVCIVGDVVYGVDEVVPAEQPCLKCRCQPPGVQCETTRCVKKPGCKAIHRPNKCCPDYQCECQNNGKIYGNGERLETQPGGECKVCYCRGGEIQCAEVSCYIRKDCEGKRVPGKCCPKYDNCPPLDSVLDKSTYTTELSLTKVDPETLEVLPLPATAHNISETFLGETINDIPDDNKIPDTNDVAQEEKHDKIENFANDQHPEITIHEIIPEIKEIPITASPKSEELSSVQTQGQLIIEEAKDFETNLNSSNDLVVTDAEPDSSEISEVFQQPPPVLRIGDKLLFLKKGELIPEKDTSTPATIITIIGAEGLQRGFEESGEQHEETIQNTSETAEDKTEGNEFELKTSESTHILSLVKRKNKPATETTPSQVKEETTTEFISTNTIQQNDTTESTTQININVSTSPSSVEAETVKSSTETVSDYKSSTETASTESIKTYEVLETNPEYPPLPDIMAEDDASQRFDTDEAEKQKENSTKATTDGETVEMKILPEVLNVRNNKTIPENTTNSAWLKNESNILQETLLNEKAALPDELLNQPSPIDDVNEDSFVENTTDVAEDNTNKENVTEITTLTTTLEQERSVETIEDSKEDSGETVTEKTNFASIKSTENASIEADESEVTDMLKRSTNKTESTTRSILHDVEIIGEVEKNKPDVMINITNVKDVEIINPNELHKIESSTRPEELPKPEKISYSPAKTIEKRENSQDSEADEVFKQLDAELNAENTQRIQTREEEEKEAEEVFKELLQETVSPKPKPDTSQARNKDADALQRVSEALAKLTLRGKQPDTNILYVLTNFFSSQYNKYN